MTIVGIIVGVLAYILVKQFLFAPPSLDKSLMKIASEINKTCPMMVDSETRLDNTTALPNNVFRYNYTFINGTVDELDVEALEKAIEPRMINIVKTSPDMKAFRDNNVIMDYYYNDVNGEFITKVSITPDEYK